MLALRARGIGAARTTYYLFYEKEAAQLLGIPSKVTQMMLSPSGLFQRSGFQTSTKAAGYTAHSKNAWGAQLCN
jgi:hypothetical protein